MEHCLHCSGAAPPLVLPHWPLTLYSAHLNHAVFYKFAGTLFKDYKFQVQSHKSFSISFFKLLRIVWFTFQSQLKANCMGQFDFKNWKDIGSCFANLIFSLFKHRHIQVFQAKFIKVYNKFSKISKLFLDFQKCFTFPVIPACSASVCFHPEPHGTCSDSVPVDPLHALP